MQQFIYMLSNLGTDANGCLGDIVVTDSTLIFYNVYANNVKVTRKTFFLFFFFGGGS